MHTETHEPKADVEPHERLRWISAQLGLTLWIALLGADVTAAGDAGTGSTMVGAAVIANVFAYMWWRQRAELGALRARRRALVTAGLLATFALIAFNVGGHSLATMGYLPASVGGFVASGCWLLVAYPLVLFTTARR